MLLALTVVRAGGADRRDLLITLDDDATVGELATELGGPSGTVWVSGRPLDPRAPVGHVLRAGALIALDPDSARATWLDEPSGLIEVRVSGGPGAGPVVRLGIGAVSIGSGHLSAVRLADPTVPQHAATVEVAAGGETAVIPAVPGLSLDGMPLTGPVIWPLGGALRVGETVLTLWNPETPDAHLAPSGDGGAAYHRPPRLRPPRRGAALESPAKPEKPSRGRLQIIAGASPAVLSVAMFAMTKNPSSLLFGLMSPVMMVATWLGDKRFGQKVYRGQMREYEEKKSAFADDLERLRFQDQWMRREEFPDPAASLLIATGPRRRLWERRLDDPDALQLRLGVIDVTSSVDVQGGEEDIEPEQTTVHEVPAAIPLASLGVFGVAGPRAPSLGLVRWLLGQAVVQHSPRDLAVVVLSLQPDAAPAWSWVRWLPHAAPRDGQDVVAMVGTDPETVSRRVAWLGGEIDRRRADGGGGPGTALPEPDPNILIILDGARTLRRVPGMPKILAEGPQYGVHAICLDEDERLLPEECRAAAEWTGPSLSRIRVVGSGLDVLGEVLADQVSAAWCERVARALAPIRDVSRDDAGSGLPTAARLLSILGMPDPDANRIEEVWAAGGRTTEAPIGMGAEGVFSVDISRDGPHALIAGTTGAGKSELLQTIIASLAVRNRPDALTFVLIDYKGGSAFLDCARLPHTVGMVSDLDAHLTKRALASLAAELKRREEILFHAAAKDIEDYWDTKRLRPELAPMPRLVLIIDEFAALFAELPEFIVGLVDIARRGRSLGVHLVLATQRPAGVVSADIRANTNLRIALRVTSGEESSDVIDARDAAHIAKATPGRCYVRSGASALVGVQAGRVGGRRPAAAGSARPRPSVAEVAWKDLGRPAPRRTEAAADGDDLTTDLQVLVDAVGAAAVQAGIAPQPSPWLEPLPGLVVAADLPVRRAEPEWEVPAVPFGVLDLPAQQARGPLLLDVVGGGHLMIVGAARSGRSTVLRTMAAQLASAASPGALHMYAFDCGANALLPLVSLPHCGAVVTRDQPERVDRLLSRLVQEVSARQQLFASQGVSSLAEQRASAATPEERLPWIVVLVDRWEGYVSAFDGVDGGRLVDSMLRLVREGAAVGVRAVFTADRSGLMGQVSTLFEERLLLRLNDVTDFAMAGVPSKEVPGTMAPGRVLRPAADGPLEGQVALLDPDASGPAQVAAIQAIGRRLADSLAGLSRERRPMRVDPLPTKITAAQVAALDPDLEVPSGLWAMAGAGRDDLTAVGIDLASEGPGFVIGGPPKSGRSTALLTMAASLADRGVPVVAIAPRRSVLRDQAGRPGFVAVLDGSEPVETFKELTAGLERYVVAVDDAELLYDTPLDAPLSEVLRIGMDGACGLLVAGTLGTLAGQYRGFVTEARKARSGLILNPQTPSDGDLLGVRLPRNAGGGPMGRGLLIRNGEMELVQVAVP